mmetsp:Transcript_18105/g.39342  ORF Transcript_18105/g.39342 Transcript_18105/m.39342 type:complete len:463 (-) Transcript_18105:22-1410(-)
MPCVPSTSFVLGVMGDIFKEPPIIPQLRWARDHGGMLIYRTFGNLKVLPTEAEALKRILVVNARNYVKPHQTKWMLTQVAGESLLTTEGDSHARQRKYLNPAFHFTHLKTFVPVFCLQARTLADTWRRHLSQLASGESFAELNISEEMNKVTLDIIGITAFGFDFEAAKSEGYNKVNAAYKQVFANAGLSVSGLVRYLSNDWIPTGAAKRTNAALAIIRETVVEIVKRKRENPGGVSTDLLSLVIEQTKQEAISEQELVDQVMTFLVAGHETTATTLSWAMYLLSVNPDAQHKAAAEVRAVAGDKTLAWDDFEKMPFLAAVLDETLRLYPAAPITSREALEDDTVAGHHIPKGTPIIICPGVVHRLERYWPEPETFSPERFLPGGSGVDTKKNPFAYLPFLVGERACIGRRFALAEATAVLATLLQSFSWEPVPGRPMRPKLAVTQRPFPDLHLRIVPRTAM